MGDIVLVAQVTDPHLELGPGDGTSAAAVEAAVTEILGLDVPPAAVLLTGDIANTASPAEYRRMRELLAPLPMPVHPIPGNHDDRDELRAAFADHAGVAGTDGYVHYTAGAGPVWLVLCDSTEPGEVPGGMGADRLAWLDAALAAGDGAPTLIAMHHPPIPLGLPAVDPAGIPDADRRGLAEMLRRHPGVRAIVAGHVHRAASGLLGSCPVLTCPSVTDQVRLGFAPDATVALVPEPPALAIHAIGPEVGLVSHFQPIGRA
jgi:3',5'-cyclic-AMP phosphodiesterase